MEKIIKWLEETKVARENDIERIQLVIQDFKNHINKREKEILECGIRIEVLKRAIEKLKK